MTSACRCGYAADRARVSWNGTVSIESRCTICSLIRSTPAPMCMARGRPITGGRSQTSHVGRRPFRIEDVDVFLPGRVPASYIVSEQYAQIPFRPDRHGRRPGRGATPVRYGRNCERCRRRGGARLKVAQYPQSQTLEAYLLPNQGGTSAGASAPRMRTSVRPRSLTVMPKIRNRTGIPLSSRRARPRQHLSLHGRRGPRYGVSGACIQPTRDQRRPCP